MKEEEELFEKREVSGVATSHKAQSLLDQAGIRRLTFGPVLGISGILLLEGKKIGLDVIALLVPSRIDAPDQVAGAKIGEALGKFVPQAKMRYGSIDG